MSYTSLMEIHSTSQSSSRPVPQAKNTRDRPFNDEKQAAILEGKAQERTEEQRLIRENLQQQKDNSQRRLDGRLIRFGYEQDNSSQREQVSFNRSRVNEAYSSSLQEITHEQRNEELQQQQKNAINVVA